MGQGALFANHWLTMTSFEQIYSIEQILNFDVFKCIYLSFLWLRELAHKEEKGITQGHTVNWDLDHIWPTPARTGRSAILSSSFGCVVITA